MSSPRSILSTLFTYAIVASVLMLLALSSFRDGDLVSGRFWLALAALVVVGPVVLNIWVNRFLFRMCYRRIVHGEKVDFGRFGPDRTMRFRCSRCGGWIQFPVDIKGEVEVTCSQCGSNKKVRWGNTPPDANELP